MNPLNIFTTKEIKLLEEAGNKIENRIYTKEEIKAMDNRTRDFIMSKSSKNNDIGKALSNYESSFEKMLQYE